MFTPPVGAIATLTIRYESASGDYTHRGVTVTDFNDFEIFGYCHLRERYRTFLVERVVSCVNAKTGEVVTDVSAYLSSIYKTLPRYSVDLLNEHHHDALKILLYVAKADGQLRQPERKVIAAACKVLTKDTRITDALANNLIDSVQLTSLHGFKIAAGKVANRGDMATMRTIFIACKTIVNTQKIVCAAEQEALDYLAKRFYTHEQQR